MSITVTVFDTDTQERQSVTLGDDDFIVVCSGDVRVVKREDKQGGRAVVTLKGVRRPRPQNHLPKGGA